MLLEGWSAWDAFYMTVITITTVGYREVHDLSVRGQVFTVLLLCGGVGAALYTFTLLVTAVVEGGVPQWLRARRHARMTEALTDHFIVCGYGRIGRVVAAQLQLSGVPFIVVEASAAHVAQAMADGVLVIEADASHEEALRRAGIARARGLISAVGTDAGNVYTVLGARELRPDLFIVSRAEAEDAARKLSRAGANRVVSPYHIGGVRMAQTAMRPAVVDFVELATNAGNLDLAMGEVTVAPTSALAGAAVRDTGLGQRLSIIVVAIQRQGQRMEFNPGADAVIAAGDVLIALGSPEALRQLEMEAAG